jgi:tetratricopeptide (TPR) repeat protein
MKAIPKLKDDARKYEQKEEWEKAIQAYLEVLRIGEQGDGAELDLPLYNRVGDLFVRLGRPSDAVRYYEQAADRYAEAGLFNNAIALCNKALRYDAGRLELFKKLGAFSSSQGFFTDARRWYLEYAEKAIKRNQPDDAFAALSEYADGNDDPEIRELLARQLRDYGRTEQAIAEYRLAYSLRLSMGQRAEADTVRAEVLALDPNIELSDTAQVATHGHHVAQEQLPGFVDVERVASTSRPMQPAAPPPPPPPPPPEPETEPEELTIEQTGVEGGLDSSGANNYAAIELDNGFGGTADDASDVAPLDVGMEAPLGVDASDIEEAEVDALPEIERDHVVQSDDDFGSYEPEEAMELPILDDFDSGDMGGELPMLEEPEAELEPLPGFDGLEVEAELPGLETTDLEHLDVGELERDEVGLAGAPLPSIDLTGGIEPEAAPEDADEAFELPSFGEMEPPASIEPRMIFEPLPTFEAQDEPEVEAIEAETEPEIDAIEAEDEPEVETVEAEDEPDVEAIEPEHEPVADAIPELPEPAPMPPAPAPMPPPPAPAPTPAPTPAPMPPTPAPMPPPPPAPRAKPKGDYVDLAALLGDDDEAEDSTRFVVAEKPPTGDEDQDFADMLEQFKAKVAESIPKEDAGSHYDLGIAFKEMGLIDEAIGEFQTALRAGQEKLKVYEELGSCFVLKGQYSVAITILNRAQQMAYTDEQELLGVYYNLGRAYEEIGQRAEARGAYEKIIAIDIGFQDTAARVSRL